MNDLTAWNFEGTEVRNVYIDGETWWIAQDICSCLEISNSRKALERLDDDEKGVTISDTPGGKQEMNIINEPGLYCRQMVNQMAEQ